MNHVDARTTTAETTRAVSERVVEAIADRDGVSPLDISPPLFDAVDPDALDRLYGEGRPGVTTTFEFAGYLVTVQPGGHVELDPL